MMGNMTGRVVMYRLMDSAVGKLSVNGNSILKKAGHSDVSRISII